MFCVACGKAVQEADRFCPSCGKSSQAVPLMPRQGRIAGHVRMLGILWIALSAFRMIPALVLLAIFRKHFPFPGGEAMPMFVLGLMRMIGYALLASGILGIMAGWGLLQRQTWARMLAIVLGCIGLVDMPFGTALGVYTLWVLLPAESEQEYKKLAAD